MYCPRRTTSLATAIAIVLHFQAHVSFANPHPGQHESKVVSKNETPPKSKPFQSEIPASRSNGDRVHWTSISDILLRAVILHRNKSFVNTNQNCNGSGCPMDALQSNEYTIKNEPPENVPKYSKPFQKCLDQAAEPSWNSLSMFYRCILETERTRNNPIPLTTFQYFMVVKLNQQKYVKPGRDFA